MRKLLIVFVLALMVLPAAVWSMGSTTNTDFEAGFTDGVANGWKAFNSGGDVALSGDNVTFHGGAWSQKIEANGEGGVLGKFDVVAGHTYTVSIMANVSGAAAAYIAVETSATEDQYAATTWQEQGPTGGAWVPLTRSITATGNAITVFLDGYYCTVNWDDLTIVDTTPPVITDPDGKTPLMLWREYTSEGGAANPFTFGGVFGGNAILGQQRDSVLLMGDVQVDGSAIVKRTPRDIGNDEWTAKGATMIGNKIYAVTGYGDFQQSTDWGALGAIIPFDQFTSPRHKPDTGGDYDASALVTDGTYLYAYETEGDNNNATNKIYKFSVNPATGAISRVSPFPISITGYSKISNIGYWNGKIYAAEAFNGGQILEIDCSTGAVTPLLSAPNLVPATDTIAWLGPYGFGQVARYGDKIFLAAENSYLYTWQLVSGTWTLVSADLLDLTTLPDYKGAFGLAVKGDGVNAKYAWISSQGHVSYWDLYPYEPTSLGNPDNYKGNYPVNTTGVVVAQGPTVGANAGFWVENQDRTAGARVLWTGAMPGLGKIVTIKATGSKTASGERLLTAIDNTTAVTVGETADPAIKPVYMTNKTMGPGTGVAGLANDGMLVKVSGKVTGMVGEKILIDDGSGVGVTVWVANDDALWDMGITGYPPSVGDQVVVTGVVRLDLVDGNVVRRIDARTASDADVKIN